MALEYKSLDIANEDEKDVIALHASFGWELKSSQRVYNQDTHLEYSYYSETRGNVYDSVTEVTDFTKIVFQREKNMAHYDELAKLEQAFYKNVDQIHTLQQEEAESNRVMVEHEKKCDLRSPLSQKIHHIMLAIPISCLLLTPIFVKFLGDYAQSVCTIALFAIPLAIWRNIASKKDAREEFRSNLGSDDSTYWKRYEVLRNNYLKQNPAIAKLVNDSPERMKMIRRLKSECQSLRMKAEKLF